MPLKKGKSRATMAANYKELRKAGHPRKQTIAIMLKEAGLSNQQKKK